MQLTPAPSKRPRWHAFFFHSEPLLIAVPLALGVSLSLPLYRVITQNVWLSLPVNIDPAVVTAIVLIRS
jgi:hypothetical protein